MIFKLKQCFLMLLGLLVICTFQPASALDLSLTGDHKQWFYYQTHDANIDVSTVDSVQWKKADVPSIFIKDPSDGIYLWYKTEFQIPSEFLNENGSQAISLFMESIRNADETWLNGIKLGSTGEISPAWNVWQKYPLNVPRAYSIPDKLFKIDKKNILLVKINTGIGDISGTEYFGSVGITGEISLQKSVSAKEQQYKLNLKSNIFDVTLIVLGLIDIFLIIFLFKNTFHHLPEFRWLVINSMLMLIATFMLDVYFLNDAKHAFFGVLRYVTVFGIPYITAVYFWSQNKNLNNKIIIFFGVIQVSMALIVLLPWFSSDLKGMAWKVTLLLVVLFFLYALYCAIRNVMKRQVGSLAQFIGLLVYFFSIRTDLFNIDLFEHLNVYIGALIFRYSLLWAYFQRIRHMSGSYKTLSQRMLKTIENKRSEFARELHDGLGQHLASSKFQAQLATVGDEKKHLSILKDEIDSAVESMHRLVDGLHPMALDRYKLKKAITIESQNIAAIYPVKFKLDLDETKLPKELEVHFFRIFQEAVTNSIHHGNAKNITINLKLLTNKIKLEITDNGNGGKKTEQNKDEMGGFGLISLQERANLIGGTLQRKFIPDKGTSIVIEVSI